MRDDKSKHPDHYTKGQIECIDAIKAMIERTEFVAYCRAQAVRYIWRSPYKDAEIGDLRKAAVYLQWAEDTMRVNPLTKWDIHGKVRNLGVGAASKDEGQGD